MIEPNGTVRDNIIKLDVFEIQKIMYKGFLLFKKSTNKTVLWAMVKKNKETLHVNIREQGSVDDRSLCMKCSYIILEITEHSGYLTQEILLVEKRTALNPSIKGII